MLDGKLRDEAMRDEMRRWIDVFDKHDAPGGGRYQDLSPMAKYVSIRAFGELRGVAPAIVRGAIPRTALPTIERDIGERILAWIESGSGSWVLGAGHIASHRRHAQVQGAMTWRPDHPGSTRTNSGAKLPWQRTTSASGSSRVAPRGISWSARSWISWSRSARRSLSWTRTSERSTGIIKRMNGLYKWVRSRSRGAAANQEVSATPTTTERERLLVLLFDDYLKTRQPVDGARLAALSGVSPASCANHLSELSKLGLVHRLDDDKWLFKSRLRG